MAFLAPWLLVPPRCPPQVFPHGVQYVRPASLEVEVVTGENPRQELTGRHLSPCHHVVVAGLRIAGAQVGGDRAVKAAAGKRPVRLGELEIRAQRGEEHADQVGFVEHLLWYPVEPRDFGEELIVRQPGQGPPAGGEHGARRPDTIRQVGPATPAPENRRATS